MQHEITSILKFDKAGNFQIKIDPLIYICVVLHIGYFNAHCILIIIITYSIIPAFLL
jgi:hypothetical protein